MSRPLFKRDCPWKERKKWLEGRNGNRASKLFLLFINETWAWLWPWRRIQLERKDWRSSWAFWAALTLLSYNLLSRVSIFSWQNGIFLPESGSAPTYYPLSFALSMSWDIFERSFTGNFLSPVSLPLEHLRPFYFTTVFFIYVHHFTKFFWLHI